MKYQLAGLDPATLQSFKPAFIPSGLFLYLLALPRPMALFPFVQLSAVPTLPWATPDGFVAPRRRAGCSSSPRCCSGSCCSRSSHGASCRICAALLFGLVGAGAVIVFVMSFILPGTTQRYTVDFMALLSLAALLIWLVTLTQAERGSWRRRLVAGSGLLVLAWGSAFGLALGFTGYYDPVKSNATRSSSSICRTRLPMPLSMRTCVRIDDPRRPPLPLRARHRRRRP